MSNILLMLYIFIFGSMIGSFLNVLIYRIPRGLGVVWERSSCPHCNMKIPFYLNIPLLGFIFLRGKCRNCKESIHWRYPFVEFLLGCYFIFTFPAVFSPMSIVQWSLIVAIFSILVCHFFIDIDYHILPDRLNLGLLLVSSLYAFLFLNWKDAIIGGVIGFIFPFLISYIFYKLKGIEGLGGGDIKLWGVLGLILGGSGIIQNIFLSSLLGSVIGGSILLIKKENKNYALAFGPYIILSYLLQFHFARFIPSFIKLF